MAWWRRKDQDTAPAGERPDLGIPAEVRALAGERTVVAFGPPGRSAWAYHVPAGEQLPEWRRLRDQHHESGWYPVLLGPEIPGEDYYQEPATEDEVREALGRDVDAWLSEHAGESYGGEAVEGDEEPETDGEPHYSVEGSDGWVALVRAAEGWEVPSALGWTGPANYDIGPADHAPVLRQWCDEYAAEIVALGPDTMELAVGRPPGSRELARELALQQYRYCPDVVDQGVGTLERLVAGLVHARSWYFWWD